MKKIVKTMLVILMSIITLTGKTKDPYHLFLDGEFLHKKNINYTVYKMGKDGVYHSEYRDKARKYYSITCDVGSKYLIRFQDKDQNVKFLMIDAVKCGYFMVDVDWRKPTDGKITLEKTGYVLTPFTNIAKAALLAKN